MTDEPKGVFDRAGTPPPPPGPQASVVPGPALEATPLGRFAFKALIPSLLLPVLATIASLGTLVLGFATVGGFDWLVVGVFCAVLLGSMALNGWLLMRHPESWRLQALPHGIAIALCILWGLLVVGAVLVAFTTFNPGTIIIGVGIMVISIVIFVMALIRKFIKVAVVPEVAVGLTGYAKAIGWGYLVVVAITIVVGLLAFPAFGPFAAIVALLIIGLPWSWPLGVVGWFVNSASLGAFGWVLSAVFLVLMIAGVVLNVVVVIRCLTSPAFRTKFVNWFFKLRGEGKNAIRTFAAQAPPT